MMKYSHPTLLLMKIKIIVRDVQSHFTILIFQNQENESFSAPLKLGSEIVKIMTSENVADALVLCALHPEINMLLVSAGLAGLTEFEVIRELRKQNPSLPIILLSHYLNLPAMRLATLLGCSEILQTPLSQGTFEGILHKYLIIN